MPLLALNMCRKPGRVSVATYKYDGDNGKDHERGALSCCLLGHGACPAGFEDVGELLLEVDKLVQLTCPIDRWFVSGVEFKVCAVWDEPTAWAVSLAWSAIVTLSTNRVSMSLLKFPQCLWNRFISTALSSSLSFPRFGFG